MAVWLLLAFFTNAVNSHLSKFTPVLASTMKYDGRLWSGSLRNSGPWLLPVHWPLPRTKAPTASLSAQW